MLGLLIFLSVVGAITILVGLIVLGIVIYDYIATTIKKNKTSRNCRVAAYLSELDCGQSCENCDECFCDDADKRADLDETESEKESSYEAVVDCNYEYSEDEVKECAVLPCESADCVINIVQQVEDYEAAHQAVEPEDVSEPEVFEEDIRIPEEQLEAAESVEEDKPEEVVINESVEENIETAKTESNLAKKIFSSIVKFD